MNEKTKIYSWLPWAVVVALVGVIGFALTFWPDQNLVMHPWVNAAGAETRKAINYFSEGVPDVSPYWDHRLRALGGIILVFVIGPSLWIFSEIRNRHKTGEEKLRKGISWYIGAVIVAGSLLLFVPSSVWQVTAYQNANRSIDESRQLDRMRMHLLTIGFEAAEKYYLPPGKGGFGWSYDSFTMDDLSSDDAIDDFSFALGSSTDSTLTIHSIGPYTTGNTEFENANGEKGKQQLTVEVAPEGNLISLTRNNTNR